MDIEQAADTLASEIFPNSEPAENVDVPDEGAEAEAPEVAEVPETPVRPPPKSWGKETHELWAKVPPEAQAQFELREKQMLEGLEQYKQYSTLGKTLGDIITPYKALLTSQGVDESKAVTALMNAHYQLSTLQSDKKLEYFRQIANTYGIQWPGEERHEDPQIKAIREELDRLKGEQNQHKQAEVERVRTKVTSDVNSFAEAKDEKGNPLRPYFDEVADDIIAHINAGKDLEKAYDAAVWANPVTRAKETARLKKEAEVQQREKLKQEGRAAREATGSTVRSRDTRRTPTEPLGKMDDTLKETLAEIKSRVH